MKKLSYYLEYLFLRALESLISAIPRKIALGIGAFIGFALYHLGIYRSIVNKNFDHVALFTPDEKKKIIKNLYKNIGRYGVDMLRSERKPPQYSVENLDAVYPVLDRKKGMIAVCAHFGNWELMATFFGSQFDLSVLARPMHNPIVEDWLLTKRKRSRVTQIYASGALRKILVALKRNGIIAMLIDQYSAEQGTPVLFLGKPANTVRTVAGLVHKTDCGVVLPYAIMQKDGSYKVVIEPVPDITVSRDNEEAFIAAHLQSHNNVISRWIQTYPDHYFGWFHRRFKDVISY
jgi:KDO2-lipid IV(A) lauroyltransferase